jgi:hypothetical protein
VLRERVEDAGNLSWNAGAHDHDVDSREHRPVQRCEIGHLHLRQQVEPDRSGVALFREPHLREVGKHRHPLPRVADALLVHRKILVRRDSRTAGWVEVPPKDFLSNVGHGERGDRASHVAPGIAVLESSHENRVEHRTGDDTELTCSCDGASKPPVRDGDTHAALNDAREREGKGHTERSPSRGPDGVTDVSRAN